MKFAGFYPSYWFDGYLGMDTNYLSKEKSSHRVLVEANVVADAARCVQCGICTFNCPIEIDVRRHAWLGKPVFDSRCLTCGECVRRCPRGVLHFERTHLFKKNPGG
jgi:heterodisulfide reductase subunit C